MLNVKEAREIVVQKREELRVAKEKAITDFIEGAVSKAIRSAALQGATKCEIVVPNELPAANVSYLLGSLYGYTTDLNKNRLIIRWE